MKNSENIFRLIFKEFEPMLEHGFVLWTAPLRLDILS